MFMARNGAVKASCGRSRGALGTLLLSAESGRAPLLKTTAYTGPDCWDIYEDRWNRYRGTVTEDFSTVAPRQGSLVYREGSVVRTDDGSVVRTVNRADTGECRIRTVTMNGGSAIKHPRSRYWSFLLSSLS